MSGAQPSPKEDTTARLIRVFKVQIADGTLTPNARLPSERDLAAKFGVSRSSLRQALKVLEVMGVISQRVGDGTYLNAGAASILREAMEFLILMDDISFDELMDARLFIEPQLTERAAERAMPEDIEKLKRVNERLEQSSADPALVVECDLLFHETLFEIAGNRVCSRMFAIVHQSVHESMELTSQLVPPEHTLAFHLQITEAIAQGSGSLARDHMIKHLRDATKLFEKAVEQDLRQRRAAS